MTLGHDWLGSREKFGQGASRPQRASSVLCVNCLVFQYTLSYIFVGHFPSSIVVLKRGGIIHFYTPNKDIKTALKSLLYTIIVL